MAHTASARAAYGLADDFFRPWGYSPKPSITCRKPCRRRSLSCRPPPLVPSLEKAFTSSSKPSEGRWLASHASCQAWLPPIAFVVALVPALLETFCLPEHLESQLESTHLPEPRLAWEAFAQALLQALHQVALSSRSSAVRGSGARALRSVGIDHCLGLFSISLAAKRLRARYG